MVRVGHGFDIHRIRPGRALILGGVHIPWERGLAGHSDADVLLHAVTDAVLGALCLGDIGQWFPDTDPSYRGAASTDLLRRVLADPRVAPWELVNLDATVIAEQPKLALHIPAIRSSIAGLFGVPGERVSVKAKTAEGTDAIGRQAAMAAHAVLLLESRV
ncbi:MAG: 2-C-methyl-D-erythritol 2,4-cyclodiphosphate synthase [Lentisphaeria bacterium]|nr:2-C-methyl-D-erythritol 2,4-cyclodiphosphate synthase [Lentisphaeria bacterium]